MVANNSNFKSYKLFFNLIKKNYIEFFYLTIILIIESTILISAVLTALPLLDYIIDPSFQNANAFSKLVEKLLVQVGIEKSLGVFIGLFVLFNTLKFVMTTFISITILNIKYSIIYRLSKNLVDAIYNAKWVFFENKNIGIILNSLTNIISKIVTGISDIALQFSFLFKILSYLAIPFFLSWKITLTTIFLVGIFTIPIKILNRYAHNWGKKNNDYDNELLQNISESYQGAKILFGFNLQKNAINKILGSLKNSILYAKKNLISQTVILNGFQPIGLISATICFFVFFESIENLPVITTVFYSLVSATPVLSSLLKGNFSIINLGPALDQYNVILKEAAVLKENNENEYIKKSIKLFKKNIFFKNVDFYYKENDLILENVDFEIKKNQFIILTGESGSGKSTLVDLILGLHKPQKGKIYVDGIDLNNIDIKSYRNLIGYVPQDPFLFNGTIYENFILGSPESSIEDINQALKKSNAFDFIDKFPNKLQTQVGERGSNISGGQRQRICLARALLKKPQILILDEPSSSLDNHSSRLIYESLEKLLNDMTIILVTHNLDFNKEKGIIKKVENKKII